MAAKTSVTPTDTITLNEDARILSHGAVTLTAGIAGTDFSGAEGSDIREQDFVGATTFVTHFALIPIPDPDSSVATIYNRTHTITVDAGAEIASAQDTRLFADVGIPIVEEYGSQSTLYGTTDHFHNGVSQTDTIGVQVDGTVRSRRVAAKTLAINGGVGNETVTQTTTVDGQTIAFRATPLNGYGDYRQVSPPSTKGHQTAFTADGTGLYPIAGTYGYGDSYGYTSGAASRFIPVLISQPVAAKNHCESEGTDLAANAS